MRVFTIIFSLYLLALSVVPCTDAITFYQPSQNSEFSQTDQHSDEHEDFCSPFCTCNCCGIAMDLKKSVASVAFTATKAECYKIIADRKTSIFSNYNGSIWQPPKIMV